MFPTAILAEQKDIMPNAVMTDITERFSKTYDITITTLFSVVMLISVCVWCEMLISDRRQLKKEEKEAQQYRNSLDLLKKKD